MPFNYPPILLLIISITTAVWITILLHFFKASIKNFNVQTILRLQPEDYRRLHVETRIPMTFNYPAILCDNSQNIDCHFCQVFSINEVEFIVEQFSLENYLLTLMTDEFHSKFSFPSLWSRQSLLKFQMKLINNV